MLISESLKSNEHDDDDDYNYHDVAIYTEFKKSDIYRTAFFLIMQHHHLGGKNKRMIYIKNYL
jgi:hypothetical protein